VRDIPITHFTRGNGLPYPSQPRTWLQKLLGTNKPKVETGPFLHWAATFVDLNGVWTITNLIARSPQEVVDQVSKNPNVKIILALRTSWLRVDRVGWRERIGA
jgi:hypothetical protein